ncbi:MAG: hypothetical protein J7K73_03895 [Nanoarchaeota archaeon]|nr:hypothetical protein [Nanoarchaeota archaeon]
MDIFGDKMLVKTFPEFFASYKVYEIVKDVLLKNMREKDANQVIKELISSEAKPDNYLKVLALILKRHVHATKASSIIMRIKEKLKSLIDVGIDPEAIEISKNGKAILKVYVQNKMESMFKIKVGVQQVDRKYTALLYDPVKTFSYTKLIKSQFVNGGKMGVFRFIIKPDVYGIQDLYELNEKKELHITLGVQAEVDGVDGVKTGVFKIPVKISKVKIGVQ